MIIIVVILLIIIIELKHKYSGICTNITTQFKATILSCRSLKFLTTKVLRRKLVACVVIKVILIVQQ